MRFGHLLLGLLCAAATAGCVSSERVTADYLEMSNDEDIVAKADDGRHYRFEAHQYTVLTDTSGHRVIRGRAKVYRGSEPQFQWFEGDVDYSALREVVTERKTILYYTPIYILVAAVLGGITIALAFGGRGVGG